MAIFPSFLREHGSGEEKYPAEALSRPGSSVELSAEARANKTPVVLVTIGIVKVTFVDGSIWSDDEAVERNTLDSSSYEKQEGCHSPTVSEMQSKTS